MASAASSAASKGALRKFIDSPAGPKTIHFWAPAMKWVSGQQVPYVGMSRAYYCLLDANMRDPRPWLLLVLETCSALPKS